MKNFNLPLCFSMSALFFCCLAIYFTLEKNFYFSFGFVLLAFLLDAIDGFVARLTDKESKFGKAIDGYIDVVNYLIYPSLVFFIFFDFKKPLFLLLIFIFLASGVYRLARFEVSGIKNVKGEMYYQGLPVFSSHFYILVVFLLFKFTGIKFTNLFMIISLPIMSLLMIQNFNFSKPKNILPVGVSLVVLSLIFLFLGLKSYGY